MEEYEYVREEANRLYISQKSVYSPALNTQVYFTVEGFNHFVFKKSRLVRELSSQIARFKLLPLAIELVTRATTFQEFEETFRPFEIKLHKKRVMKNRIVRYWAIGAIWKGKKLNVIVRKIGEGNCHFWSIVPDWTTTRYRDIRFQNTMEGNPEKD